MLAATMVDDSELLVSWRGGDKRAGEALFERHFDAMHRFFCRKVDAEAADLVQRVFLRCLEAQDRFRGDSRFRTFLFAIARNVLLEHYRGKRKEAAVDFGVSSLLDLGASPSQVVAQRGEQRLMLDALRGLPVDLQIAVELFYWEELEGRELAQVLDIPEGTVRTRLRRARSLLRTRMEELVGEPTDDDGIERAMGSVGALLVAEA